MTCDKVKQQDTGSFFCDRHTCLFHTCLELVPGTTNDHPLLSRDPFNPNPSHYCNMHRPCSAADCTRPCYIRANGTPAIKYCGDHYCACDAAACNQQRIPGGGDRCREHTCDETDCVRAKRGGGGGNGAGGRFCDEHTCKTKGCEERRDRRWANAEYCPFHTCSVAECAKNGSAGGGRCDIHRECNVASCREWILVEKGADGDIMHPVCEKREQLFPLSSLPLSPQTHSSYAPSSSKSLRLTSPLPHQQTTSPAAAA